MILILEDDILIAEHIKTILENDGFHQILVATQYDEAVDLIQHNLVRLALLDINLNEERTGIDFSAILNSHGIQYIYISAQSDPVHQANIVNSQPLGYILKPFKPIQVSTTVRIVYNQLKKSVLRIDDGKQKHHIHMDTIHFIKSSRNYTEINFEDTRILVRKTLSEIKVMLPDDTFLQCHRSFVVNTSKITSISSREISVGKANIPLSSSHRKTFDSF